MPPIILHRGREAPSNPPHLLKNNPDSGITWVILKPPKENSMKHLLILISILLLSSSVIGQETGVLYQ